MIADLAPAIVQKSNNTVDMGRCLINAHVDVSVLLIDIAQVASVGIIISAVVGVHIAPVLMVKLSIHSHVNVNVDGDTTVLVTGNGIVTSVNVCAPPGSVQEERHSIETLANVSVLVL